MRRTNLYLHSKEHRVRSRRAIKPKLYRRAACSSAISLKCSPVAKASLSQQSGWCSTRPSSRTVKKYLLTTSQSRRWRRRRPPWPLRVRRQMPGIAIPPGDQRARPKRASRAFIEFNAYGSHPFYFGWAHWVPEHCFLPKRLFVQLCGAYASRHEERRRPGKSLPKIVQCLRRAIHYIIVKTRRKRGQFVYVTSQPWSFFG